VPKVFEHKWKLSSIFIRCPLLLSRINFLKCQMFFEHQDVSRVPNFFGQKSTFIAFPVRLKFPKLPKYFLSILEKKSNESFWAQICQVPKISSEIRK
jgi:hypothetical protein